ncbi:MAG: outer membrane protein assembly factor BamE, partial [Alphaproteobacteria bacterium]|nr:outer membrane protein assembly factor BamE [Alphaproteobacteria bacterium]
MPRSLSSSDQSHSRASRWIKLFASATMLVSLAGCLSYDGDVPRGYQIDDQALEKIKAGTSAEQVLSIMGTPSTTSTIGGSAWYYISQQTNRQLAYSRQEVTDQRVLAIYFTKANKVERIANYGMQDGQVFDFVT